MRARETSAKDDNSGKERCAHKGEASGLYEVQNIVARRNHKQLRFFALRSAAPNTDPAAMRQGQSQESFSRRDEHSAGLRQITPKLDVRLIEQKNKEKQFYVRFERR